MLVVFSYTKDISIEASEKARKHGIIVENNIRRLASKLRSEYEKVKRT